MATLFAAPPWAEHRFPHKRITRKVCRARMRYRCQKVGPAPADHAESIDSGEEYLRVAIRPTPGDSRGWSTVLLCRGCAIHYGLATPSRPRELTT